MTALATSSSHSTTSRRRVVAVSAWLLVAAVVFIAWPAQLGGRLGLVVVAGHSMDGTYRTGDLLLTWQHADYAVGDVVVYRVPDGEPASGLRVVHRVIGSDGARYTTRGDNSDSADIWHPTASDVDGRPFAVVPSGGLVLRWLLSPVALALLCASCVYLLVKGGSQTAAPPANSEQSRPVSEDRSSSAQ